MSKAFTGLLRKQDDKLVYMTNTDEIKYEMFRKNVPEDTLVEIYMEIQKDDGTLAQLAKIHSMIRQLCNHTGDTFEDMKLLVKKRSGLCIEKEIDGSKFLYCKSLGNSSKEELSMVIETLEELSRLLEFPLQ